MTCPTSEDGVHVAMGCPAPGCTGVIRFRPRRNPGTPLRARCAACGLVLGMRAGVPSALGPAGGSGRPRCSPHFGRTSALDAIARAAVGTIDSCDAAGVRLGRPGPLLMAGASGEAALALDRIQRATGRGPIVECCQNGEARQVDSLARSARWPELAAAAEQLGIRGVLVVPSEAIDGRLAPRRSAGAIALYSRREQAFDERAVAAAEGFAREVSRLADRWRDEGRGPTAPTGSRRSARVLA